MSGAPERALAHIWNLIQSGKIKPGNRIIVSSYTAGSNVGQGSFRDALIGLYHLGIVNHINDKGFSLNDISEKDFDDILLLRATLEAKTISLGIKRLRKKENEFNRIITILKESVEKMAPAEGQLANIHFQFDDIHTQFHRKLWEMSESKQFVLFLEQKRKMFLAFHHLRAILGKDAQKPMQFKNPIFGKVWPSAPFDESTIPEHLKLVDLVKRQVDETTLFNFMYNHLSLIKNKQ